MYFEYKQRFLSEHIEEKELAEAKKAIRKKEECFEFKDDSGEDDETDPMLTEDGRERPIQHREQLTTVNEEKERDDLEVEEGEEVNGAESNIDLLYESMHSATVSFVSDLNKSLPVVQVLYIDEATFFYFALITHLVIVLGALFIEDIITIFDFGGCFFATFILFLFPSVIFLAMLRKHGKTKHHNSCEYSFYKVMAYILIVLGIVTFTISVYDNIQNLTVHEGLDGLAEE